MVCYLGSFVACMLACVRSDLYVFCRYSRKLRSALVMMLFAMLLLFVVLFK